MKYGSATAVALAIWGIVGTAWAQDKTDFSSLQSRLKQEDKVTLTTVGGDKLQGRLLEVSANQIVLQLKGGARTVDADQIQKVQKRKNGVLLGALVGVGVAIPFSVALSTYAHNEGASAASFVLFPVAIGLAAGTGIDAAIGSNKTLYERSSGPRITLAPVILPKAGVGGRVSFKF